VVGDAIANRLHDPRIEPMSSVTRVDVSADLEHVRIWVSVMGNEAAQRRTIDGLQSARGHVQRLVARQLPLRQCPKIAFRLDESIKRGMETIRIIEESVAEDRRRAAERGESYQEQPDSVSGDDA
jgi:ribosome-binding factor A